MVDESIAEKLLENNNPTVNIEQSDETNITVRKIRRDGPGEGFEEVEAAVDGQDMNELVEQMEDEIEARVERMRQQEESEAIDSEADATSTIESDPDLDIEDAQEPLSPEEMGPESDSEPRPESESESTQEDTDTDQSDTSGRSVTAADTADGVDDLFGDLTDIRGIGPATAEKLRRENIETPEDLRMAFARGDNALGFLMEMRADQIAEQVDASAPDSLPTPPTDDGGEDVPPAESVNVDPERAVPDEEDDEEDTDDEEPPAADTIAEDYLVVKEDHEASSVAATPLASAIQEGEIQAAVLSTEMGQRIVQELPPGMTVPFHAVLTDSGFEQGDLGELVDEYGE